MKGLPLKRINARCGNRESEDLALRTLILGATGMLGHKLWQVFADQFDTYLTFRQAFESYAQYKLFDPLRVKAHVSIQNFDSVIRAITVVRPQVVINCIGIVKQRAAATCSVALSQQ